MGPPGSGKGTQAAKLAKAFGFAHVSTGDLFRDHVRRETPLGKEIKALMEKGELAGDHIVMGMLQERLDQADCKKGVIIDGVPRRVSQAEGLEGLLPSESVVTVLNLQVPEEEIIKRATGRLVCKACGHIQHLIFSPPAQTGICDQCGGELMQRADDKEEVVRHRWAIYLAETSPVLDYYKKKGELVEVDGTKSPEEVFNALKKAIL